MIKFIIPFTLPTINDVVGANRANRYQGAGQKRYWQSRVEKILRRGARPLREPVTIRWVWVEKDRRRDPDNVSGGGRKIILDAMVRVKLLRGDGWENISPPMVDEWRVDKKRPRVEIYVTEAGECETISR